MANHIVIPARFGSSRLPGKPLLDIDKKPLIWHVYQRALESNIDSIVVATDHIEIFNAVKAFDGNVIMTSASHVNGTERLAEVAKELQFNDDDIVINLQGDEPLIPSDLIEATSKLLVDNPSAGIATLCCRINEIDSVFSPNIVKVTRTDLGKALYFSRAPIPWDRDAFKDFYNVKREFNLSFPYYRHIGLYAYRVKTLEYLQTLAESQLERCESLEQLRALQAGIEIQVGEIGKVPPHGVDTMEDYLNIKRIVEERHES